MDYKVVWSPEAIEDLQSIAEYIERDSEFYARAVVIKILDVSRSIKNLPLRGRVVPEVGDDNIRELFIYSYRVIYQIQESEILIVAVIHGKQLFENISERF
ncbi:MAG: type II toxin-antitoxin system RelE/ParE family toxin [Nitrospirae bacterium]|nr:type II toxin-antitoxin system RelE/ParE family toxin [Nitrospirota bacterium]